MSQEIQKVREERKNKGDFRLSYAYKGNVSRTVAAVTTLMKEIRKDFPGVPVNEIDIDTFKGITCSLVLSFTAKEIPTSVHFQSQLKMF